MPTKKIFFLKQTDRDDNGATCLQMITHYYDSNYDIDTIKKLWSFKNFPTSLMDICEGAEKIGLKTRIVRLSIDRLISDVKYPCILLWEKSHFVVFIPSKKNKIFTIANPAIGLLNLTKEEFINHWMDYYDKNEVEFGNTILIEPTVQFYETRRKKKYGKNWKSILYYLKTNHRKVWQVFLLLFFTSLMQVIFPYLTISIIDNGIKTKNLPFITIVLFAQIMLIFSYTLVEFIKSRILLSLSMLINVSMLSHFLIKLARLPLSYFENRHLGDTLQRINDNKQVESFITGHGLSALFSVINLLVFSIILMSFKIKIFLLFFIGSVLYFFWIQLFINIHRKINYELFHIGSTETSATLQYIQGMTDIRLNNAEKIKRWDWEDIQIKKFKLNLKSLKFNQWQRAGAVLINHGKDVLITFVAASFVIKGELTLGALFGIQYMIGQLSGPVEELSGFIKNAQDATISIERFNEIHSLDDEEKENFKYINTLANDKSIEITNLTFCYPESEDKPIINNLNLSIPEGKVTAIVGLSGSGKTTLLKILLKFYDSYNGEIRIGGTNLKNIAPNFWRKQCGAVLQEGFIFDDSIAKNIVMDSESFDYARLVESCKVANILTFVESLPKGFYTELGSKGMGISQGQKQRLLIARSIYKNPNYLFFDEATNALDANNEKIIVENLQTIFEGRTVIIVAHRLSTVMHADNIIVFSEGKVLENGNHIKLLKMKGKYYELVKNQLDFIK